MAKIKSNGSLLKEESKSYLAEHLVIQFLSMTKKEKLLTLAVSKKLVNNHGISLTHSKCLFKVITSGISLNSLKKALNSSM